MFKKCKKLALGFLVSVFVCGGNVAFNHLSASSIFGFGDDAGLNTVNFDFPNNGCGSDRRGEAIGDIKGYDGEDVTVYAKNDRDKNEVSFYFYNKNRDSKCIIYLDQLSNILSSRSDLKGTESVVFENVEQIYTDEYSHKNDSLDNGSCCEPGVSMISLFPEMQFFACESLVIIGNRVFWNTNYIKDSFISITTPILGKIGSYAFANNKRLGLGEGIRFDEVDAVGEGAFYQALENVNVGLWNMDMSDSQLRGKVFQGSLAKTVNCVLLKEDKDIM